MEVTSALRLAREGEPVRADDFDAVFTRERVPMVRLAYLMLRDEAHAEEVVQDAFVSVFERWDRLDNAGAYLRRCVVNGCLSRMRRARRRIPEPVGRTEAELATDHTLDAVRRLSPQRQTMVVLRYYADMTQDEIADTLRLPVGTVKSGLHRALGELKEALRDGVA
jgi:RNA polymerase sigma-70 factor (sigma-E family)